MDAALKAKDAADWASVPCHSSISAIFGRDKIKADPSDALVNFVQSYCVQ